MKNFNIINGYGMREEEYDLLLDKLYGFEEYYYYKQDKHYKDYLFVINELDKIKHNVPMEESYKNAIIGWYIFFKNSKRCFSSSQLCMHITNACQLKCKHCYHQQKLCETKHMTFDEFVYLFYKHKEIIQHFFHYNEKNKLQSVDIAGGEATLNPEIYKMIKFINDKGIPVHIDTNGINVSDELIFLLKQNNKNSVQISIDGFEKTHDFIRGEGTFKKSISTLKKLAEAGIKINTNMAIHDANVLEYETLKKYINSTIGCHMGSMLYTPQGSSSPLNFLCKNDLEEYLKLSNRPTSNPGNCNQALKCTLGYQNVIREDGGFSSCPRGYDLPIANYFTDDNETILYNLKTFTLRWRSVPVYCFNCKKVSTCLGGMLCHNSVTDECYTFNQADKICYLMNNKDVGEMYEIQTYL